jgi:hypothetical protein
VLDKARCGVPASKYSTRCRIEPSPDDELTFKAAGIVPLW